MQPPGTLEFASDCPSLNHLDISKHLKERAHCTLERVDLKDSSQLLTSTSCACSWLCDTQSVVPGFGEFHWICGNYCMQGL